MDEATANIDQHTDSLIQDVVRTSFRGKTVIMVAHRLNTVIDCDQVRNTGSELLLDPLHGTPCSVCNGAELCQSLHVGGNP